jgi:(1->4)-alpha-D-glucan 1-alpha-D-glucosylmutase
LVDPDNRRPVDYQERREALVRASSLTPAELWKTRQDGTLKLYTIQQTLALRARQPQAFSAAGEYRPLKASGAQEQRIIAFQRGDDVIGVATRWHESGAPELADTQLALPEGRWQNALDPGCVWAGTVAVRAVLGSLPIAALERFQLTS